MKPTYLSDEETDGGASNAPSAQEDDKTHTEILKTRTSGYPSQKLFLYKK